MQPYKNRSCMWYTSRNRTVLTRFPVGFDTCVSITSCWHRDLERVVSGKATLSSGLLHAGGTVESWVIRDCWSGAFQTETLHSIGFPKNLIPRRLRRHLRIPESVSLSMLSRSHYYDMSEILVCMRTHRPVGLTGCSRIRGHRTGPAWHTSGFHRNLKQVLILGGHYTPKYAVSILLVELWGSNSCHPWGSLF